MQRKKTERSRSSCRRIKSNVILLPADRQLIRVATLDTLSGTEMPMASRESVFR